MGFSAICNVLAAIKMAQVPRARPGRRDRHRGHRRRRDVRQRVGRRRSPKHFAVGSTRSTRAEAFGQHLLGRRHRSRARAVRSAIASASSISATTRGSSSRAWRLPEFEARREPGVLARPARPAAGVGRDDRASSTPAPQRRVTAWRAVTAHCRMPQLRVRGLRRRVRCMRAATARLPVAVRRRSRATTSTTSLRPAGRASTGLASASTRHVEQQPVRALPPRLSSYHVARERGHERRRVRARWSSDLDAAVARGRWQRASASTPLRAADDARRATSGSPSRQPVGEGRDRQRLGLAQGAGT